MLHKPSLLKYILCVSEFITFAKADSGGPSMKMFFHGGINDYLMFESWVPQTQLSYAAGWILFFFLAVSLEGVLVYINNVQYRWIEENEKNHALSVHSSPESTYNNSNSFFSLSPVVTWFKALLLSVFQALESTLAYFLMLVTMIFNTGLFFSVVAGHSVGVFLFSRFRSKYSLNNEDVVVYGNSPSNSHNPVLPYAVEDDFKVSNSEASSSCH